MHLIARLTADHRALGWCLVIALSLPAVLGFWGMRVADPVTEGWIPQESLDSLREVEATFSLNSPLILVLECDDFFLPDQMQAVQATVAELRTMPAVAGLTWLGDIPEVSLRGRVTPIIPDPLQADGTNSAPGTHDTTTDNVAIRPEGEPTDLNGELEAAKRKLLVHPLAQRNLISEDGKTLILLIDTEQRSDIAVIKAVAVKHLQPAGIRTRVTGSMAMFELHDRILEEDHFRIQMLSYVVVSLLSIVIFRRPVAIFLAGIGPIVGVGWTLGWLQLIGQANNELAKIILPVLIMMIGFTDGMHMVIRIRQLRADGHSPRDAVYKSVCFVGPACFLTSVTTAIGFGSLMFSGAEMVSGFGRVSAIGVTLTFLSVILVTPLLANSWLGKRMHVSAAKDPLAIFMKRSKFIVMFSTRHAHSVTIVGVVLTICCFSIAMNLVPDDSISDRVPFMAEESQALRHCDDVIGGIRFLRVVINWDDSISRAQLWPVIKECEEALSSQPLLGDAMSIRTCLTVFKAANVQDQFILESKLPEELGRQFYRPDVREAQVVCRLQDRGIARYESALARLNETLNTIAASQSGIRIQMISDLAIEGTVVKQMIEELMRSLAMASFIIFGVLAIAFRSLRIGLISIIPNVMPLAVSGALRLVIDESLGIASACSFAICLGIAVDDTIHYLNHFRHERSLGRSAQDANSHTFVTVGSALIMTTVVMSVGLATVMTSRMPPFVNFAAMGCATLGTALLADLLFLPALLTLFPGKLPEQLLTEEQPPGHEA